MDCWSTSKLAEALHLTARRVRQLVDERILSAPTRGGFEPFTAVNQYHVFLKKQLESEELAQARAAHLRMVTKRKALEYAISLNEVHDVNQCWRQRNAYRRRVEEHYDQIPARVFGALAGEAASLAARYGKNFIPTKENTSRMLDIMTIEAASLKAWNPREFLHIFGKEEGPYAPDDQPLDPAGNGHAAPTRSARRRVSRVRASGERAAQS